MVSATEPVIVRLVSNGGAVYATPLRVNDASELRVWVTLADGTASLLTSGYYAVSLSSEKIATLTFNYPPVSGSKITVIRTTSGDQNLDLISNSRLPAEEFEAEFDKLTRLIREQSTRQVLRFHDAEPAGSSSTLPLPPFRADRVLYFNNYGNMEMISMKDLSTATVTASTVQTAIADDVAGARSAMVLGSAAIESATAFAPANHTHDIPSAQIADSTAQGRALLTAATAALQRASLGILDSSPIAINNVAISSPENRNALLYETLSGKWKNRPITAADIADGVIQTGSQVTTALGYTPANVASPTLTGHVQLSGQSSQTLTDNSAMTRKLSDERYTQSVNASKFGVVYGISDDAAAAANSVALTAAFASSASTGSTIIISGVVYTKGENLIGGIGVKIFGINKAQIIQKDILHNGLTLSEASPPASLSISNLSLAGQGYATHLTAGIYGRRASGLYFFSDINLINIGISGFDMGLDFRNIVKLYTNNVSVYSCRVGYNMDKVDTYLIENTRIVGSSSTADIPNSVCFKFSDQSFGGKVIMGEFGGEHIARFCEISGAGVEAVFEGCNLELFTSAQVNTITSTGAHTFVFRDGRCTRRLDGANTDAFLSMNTSGNRVNSVEIVNLSDWPFSGRVVETYGSNSGPTVSGAPVKLTYTTSAAAAATAEYLANVGVRDWPVTAEALPISSALRGETISWTPSTITRGTDDWMQAPLHKLYNNRSGTVQWFTSINAQLMQVIGATQDGSSVVGTGTIMTATLPANMLFNTGESISLRISGKTASNTNDKQIRIKLNGQILFDSAVFTSSNVDWKLDFECHTGVGYEKWDAQLFVADAAYGINGTKLASGDTGPATWYGNTAGSAGVFTVETVTPTAAGDVTYRNGKAIWTRGPSTNSIK